MSGDDVCTSGSGALEACPTWKRHRLKPISIGSSWFFFTFIPLGHEAIDPMDPPKPQMSVLSDKAVLRHIEQGTVVIYPFDPKNLSTSSYDVTLGPFYFQESDPEPGRGILPSVSTIDILAIYNPFSEEHVKRVWGEPKRAEKHKIFAERVNITPLHNIEPDDEIIWVKPGETILAHTNEFIGTTSTLVYFFDFVQGGKETVTTMMKARSSLGRNFIEVCKCAGWGDVGYVNRWY